MEPVGGSTMTAQLHLESDFGCLLFCLLENVSSKNYIMTTESTVLVHRTRAYSLRAL